MKRATTITAPTTIEKILATDPQQLIDNPIQTTNALIDALVHNAHFLRKFSPKLAKLLAKDRISHQLFVTLAQRVTHHAYVSNSIKYFQLAKPLMDFIEQQNKPSITLPLEHCFRVVVHFIDQQSNQLNPEKLESTFRSTVDFFNYVTNDPARLLVACQHNLLRPIAKQDEFGKTILHHLLASDLMTTNPEQFLQSLAIFLTHITGKEIVRSVEFLNLVIHPYQALSAIQPDSLWMDEFEKLIVDMLAKFFDAGGKIEDASLPNPILKILYRQATHYTAATPSVYRKKCSALAASLIDTVRDNTPHCIELPFEGPYDNTDQHFKYLANNPMPLFIALQSQLIRPINKQDKQGKTIVHHLLEATDAESFAQLLMMLAENISHPQLTEILNLPDHQRLTPLHHAINNRQIAHAYALLDAGANPKAVLDTLSEQPCQPTEVRSTPAWDHLLDYMRYQSALCNDSKEAADELVVDFFHRQFQTQSDSAAEFKQDDRDGDGQLFLNFLINGRGFRYLQTYEQLTAFVKQVIHDESARPVIDRQKFRQIRQMVAATDRSLFSYQSYLQIHLQTSIAQQSFPQGLTSLPCRYSFFAAENSKTQALTDVNTQSSIQAARHYMRLESH